MIGIWASFIKRAVIAAVLLFFSSSLDAALQMAVEMRPSVNSSGEKLAYSSKLSADLRATEQSNGKFVGTTMRGRPVIEYERNISSQQVLAQLAEVPEVTGGAVIENAQLEPINELVIFGSDNKLFGQKSVADLEIVRRYGIGRFVVVKSVGGFSAQQLKRLEEDASVGYAEPNYKYHLVAASPPNDPDYVADKLWGMANIHAPEAWKTATKSSVIVAVIDTGVDYGHPDLKDNMWRNPGETGIDNLGKDKATNGKDDDGDGFIDDVYGVDFYNNDGDPKGGQSHGTHCAGTIGAVGNNNLGVVGVNWGVKIMALQIFDDAGKSSADADKIAQAIDFAVSKGAKVLNNSWGGGASSTAIKDAISRAGKANVLFIAAAGNDANDNDSQPFYPASYTNKNIIAVAAIDSNDALSSFSNYGQSSVHIAAPGSQIYSTMPNGGYDYKSGTSMAAPHVSGAAALVWESSNYATASALMIKQALLDNARKLPTLASACGSGGTLDLQFLGPQNSQPKIGAPSNAGSQTNVGQGHKSVDNSSNEKQILKGQIRYPVFAIGGETTGCEIKTDSGTYELDLRTNEQLKRQAKELAGHNATIEGTVAIRHGVETGARYVVEVSNIKAEKN